MKIRILLPALLLTFSLPAFAQVQPPTTQPVATPPSTPVVASCSQVNVGTEYIHFSNGMSGTMVEAAHPFTDCTKKYILSMGFADLMVPAANTSFYLMGPRVDLPLANIVPKAKLDQALNSLVLFGGAGFGTAQVSPPNESQRNHFAYGLHGGLAVSPGSIFGASVQFQIEAGLVGYNRTVFRATTLPGTSAQFAAGVIFNIGQKK